MPVLKGPVSPEVFINEFIESVKTERTVETMKEKAAAAVACHSAKRSGDHMNMRDIESLVEFVNSGRHELKWPHGRPFIFTLNKNDFERMFKRI